MTDALDLCKRFTDPELRTFAVTALVEYKTTVLTFSAHEKDSPYIMSQTHLTPQQARTLATMLTLGADACEAECEPAPTPGAPEAAPEGLGCVSQGSPTSGSSGGPGRSTEAPGAPGAGSRLEVESA